MNDASFMPFNRNETIEIVPKIKAQDKNFQAWVDLFIKHKEDYLSLIYNSCARKEGNPSSQNISLNQKPLKAREHFYL